MFSDLMRSTLARWPIVLICALLATASAVYTASRMPPRYVAKAAVLMELIRPDPETGEIVPGKMVGDYIGTQMRLASSAQTTRHMIRQFGWLEDPALQDEFLKTGRPMAQMEDWLAGRLAGAVSVSIPDETNILELAYSAPDPDNAKLLVDSLRSAFLTEVVERKREAARRSADWLDRQGRFTLRRYLEARDARNRYAKAHGYAIGQNPSMERKLAEAMVERGGVPISPAVRAPVPPRGPSPLRSAAGPSVVGRADAAAPERDARAVETEDAPVIRSLTQSADPRFKTLADQAKLASETYLAIVARRNQALQDATTGDSNFSAFGEATASDVPAFPVYPRIVGGALFLGILLGAEVALISELLHRRVRIGGDLQRAVGSEVLATVRGGRRRFLRRPAWLRRRSGPAWLAARRSRRLRGAEMAAAE